MCGICGFNWDDKQLLKQMTSSILHRGPNDDGYYSERHISLGMRRLSIIDVSKGKQPIYNEDGSICVVYNGEIYNYKHLRKELEAKGHRFATNSDTEVIVHGYEEYGEGILRHLNGMFGISLWDSKQKKLLLAVDRMGIKPLYYSHFGKKLIFASEIKAILQCEDIKRKINQKAMLDYLTFRYTPTEQTILDGIKKLPPGHSLTLKEGNIQINRYWDAAIDATSNESEDFYAKKIISLLKDSVQMQMMSEVPLGIYLSGGLDSSVITAFMRSFTDANIKTFSVGFEAQEPFNESRYAKMVADHYHTQHHEVMVTSESARLLPHVLWHLGDIDNDPTMIAQYQLSKFAKKHVTVVLTGEGADELFGGYDEFKMMVLAKRYGHFAPKAAFEAAAKGISMVPNTILDRFFHFASSLGEKGKERLIDFSKDLDNNEKMYMTLTSFFGDKEKKELYSDDLYAFENKYGNHFQEIRPYLQGSTKENILNKLIYLDMKRRLPYHLLHKMDKMTMAHSIEGRVPFLDNHLVDFSFTIPTHLKLKGLTQKYILKKAAKNLLPKEILSRKKHPFVAPLDAWFKKDVKDMAEEAFASSSLCENKLLKKEYLRKILNEYSKSKLYYGRQLWAILSLDVWHKLYIENDDMRTPKLDFSSLYG
jgi:asparagine synthase (glutamine-hydrolysing)